MCENAGNLSLKSLLLTSGSGATGGFARGKAILEASGVRGSFCCSVVGGVVNFWPMCWSITSQAAGEKHKVTEDLRLEPLKLGSPNPVSHSPSVISVLPG